MRPSDAGERALVAEQRVELAALAGEDRGERPSVDRERVRPEVREVLVELLRGTIQTPARFFLPASVRTSSPPSAKRSWNIGRAGPFFPAGR